MEPGDKKYNIHPAYYRYLWWGWQLFVTVAAVFFMGFGFSVLSGAYRLDDPFSFIITFFSSNLIILISAVMIIAFVYRMVNAWRTHAPVAPNNPDDPGTGENHFHE